MSRFIFILIITIVTTLAASAQYSSDAGRFTIPDKFACAPYGGPIVINVPECDGVSTACSVDFNFGDGVPNTLAIVDGAPVNFQYTTPGTYIIRIQFGTTGGFDQVEINILPNTAPEFNIYTCSANRVQLEITDPQYAEYAIDYQNDNATDDVSAGGIVSPFFTYPSSATQTISVRGNYPNCASTQKTVTPVPGPFSPTPAIINELRIEPDNTISLDLNTDANFFHQLDISTNSAGSFTKLQNVTDETTLTLGGLDPESNYYCFRVGTINICDSPAPNYTGTNVVCSSDLNLSVLDDEMRLNWNTSNTGVNAFGVLRTPGAAISQGAAPPFQFIDTDVVCGTAYTYQLVNEYNGGVRSFSKIVSGTAISNRQPSAISDMTTVAENDAVQLSWIQDPSFDAETYSVFRLSPGKEEVAGTTATPSFSDSEYTVGNKICYQIEYTDLCGNESARSRSFCPINLNAALMPRNVVKLSWNAYNGWAAGVDRYEVKKYDQNGSLIQTIPVGNVTQYEDASGNDDSEQVYIYRVCAYATDGALLTDPSVSNPSRVIKSPNFSHPKAFVPASSIEDNKTFRVYGSYINTYEIRVFNRWGELLFQSDDPGTGWDGTFNGQRMPEGTYVFIAKITDQAGRSFDYAATVLLLKKG